MMFEPQQFPLQVSKGAALVPLCVISYRQCSLCQCCSHVRIVTLVPQCLALMATSGLVCKTYHEAGSKSCCKL